MNYDQLKALSWQELMDLLVRTASTFRDVPNYSQMVYDHTVVLTPPSLCLLGDFEIRARFYEPAKLERPHFDAGDPLDPPDHIVAMDEHNDLRAKYHELLYAVARKWPGEDRHQTALRYIREAEERATQGPHCEAKPQPPAAA